MEVFLHILNILWYYSFLGRCMARAAAASPLVSPIIYFTSCSTEVHDPVTTQGEVDFEKQLLFSVTHVTAHRRKETSVSTPQLCAALLCAWIFTMQRGTVMRTYVFHSTLYLTLPVRIHILYIYISILFLLVLLDICTILILCVCYVLNRWPLWPSMGH